MKSESGEQRIGISDGFPDRGRSDARMFHGLKSYTDRKPEIMLPAVFLMMTVTLLGGTAALASQVSEPGRSPEEIIDRGVLRVGTAGDYQPMSYLDPDQDDYVGFDAALAEDLAGTLGVEIEYVKTSWPTLMEDTLAGNFDLAVCGITITDARKEQALMSEGYLENGKTVLCRTEDADKYTSLEAINQPQVRVMENPGGLNEKFARENLPDAELIIHDVNQEIPGLVASGEADVMITEVMEAGYYVGQDSRLAAPLIYEPFTQGELGFLMPKGSEDLLEYVNEFLDEEKESGRIDELAEEYIYRSPAAALSEQEKTKIKVLLLPKFEVGELSGDFPGEAQYYYEKYLEDSEEYSIPAAGEGAVLYEKDGIALFVLGMGKVNAALNTMAVLSDSRFDFSDAYIISTGCAGSAAGYGVMGDVFVITAAVDYDLGHHADIREMEDQSSPTWFHASDYDETASVMLDADLTDQVYALVKDVPLETTERTREYMRAAFDGAEWAVRDPKVLKGTTVTSDNYWKGTYAHENAELMIQTYGCPDPFALSEMEDIAVAKAAERMGMLDRFLIIRDSVNMDVFMLGSTPESLWDPEYESQTLASEDNVEAADIFETAMKNNLAVGSVIIDAIISGDLSQ